MFYIKYNCPRNILCFNEIDKKKSNGDFYFKTMYMPCHRGSW